MLRLSFLMTISVKYYIKLGMKKFGFTVIELTIVIALLTVIAGVVLLSSTRFTGQSALQTQTEEIAASIRSAKSKAMRLQTEYRVYLSKTEYVVMEMGTDPLLNWGQTP